MKLWAGRFNKATNQLVDEYNASISFDYQLAEYDIQGSLTHIDMLAKCSIIAAEDASLIRDGLLSIRDQIRAGQVSFRQEDEDIHMNIERLLHEKIGAIAGKLHTGRSRNDQVALDVHLYLRHQIVEIVSLLSELLIVIHTIASTHVDTFLPGYTHLQRAEPIRFAHHMLAYFNMFSRDVSRLCDSFSRVNQNPLGAGALAGSGIAVDREYVVNALHFDGLYTNSLDAVSDRDFVVEFLAHASLIMMHISRLSEEIILWSTQEFSFVQLDDAFCTGSSMMPQKKNPDICELARGKTGRVYGALMGLLTMLKGLPLAYNKDMQEDKEGLFDTVNTLIQTLTVYTPMLASMRINKDIMRTATENDFSNATNLANYITQKGITFRSAHEITGKIVLHCIDNDMLLKNIPLKIYQNFCEKIDEDVYQSLGVEAVIEAHRAVGGTSKQSVENQLSGCGHVLYEIKQWIEHHQYVQGAG